ncbi:MAG: redoxin domain-containing protein [Thiomargarita sp.]|nr:redoxin domain-containing protein [Thiomargarita sp.]
MTYLRLNFLVLLIILWNASINAITLDELAPIFSLQDTSGETINLSDFRTKHIILEWFNPDCVEVQNLYQQKVMQQLAKKYEGFEVIWLAINSTYYMTQEDNIRWKETNNLRYYVLGDFSGKIAQLYKVKTTPEVFIINPEGILIYRGAIDNKMIEEQRKANIVENIEESLAIEQTNVVAESLNIDQIAGKNSEAKKELKIKEENLEIKQLEIINYVKVILDASLANQVIIGETKPYGCDIKYAY